jgi:hypothetical protein
MRIRIVAAVAVSMAVTSIGEAQRARPTLADASPYVTQMNGGRPVDCTATKVKIRFGSGRGEGYCQAVLADLIKSWESGIDISSQDTLIPANKMPSAPPSAFELKGDKVGSSMAEYLQHHSGDCVANDSASPVVHNSIFSGNVLEHANHQHVNAFLFACQNSSGGRGQITLATAEMDWEEVEFSHQRLFLVAYFFKHDSFALVLDAFVMKFGAPTSTSEVVAKNLLGAQLTRSTMTWKNGVSTIVLSEMSGDDLTRSRVEMTLDDIFSAVSQSEGGKVVKAVQKDM